LAIGARDIVPLLLGAKWAAAAPIITIFCIVRAFGLLDAATAVLLVCYDRQRFMLTVQIIVSLATLAASVILAGLGTAAVAIGVGAILVGLSLTYGREALRLSGCGIAQLAAAATVALTPAAGVVAAIVMLRLVDAMDESLAWLPFVSTILAGTLGFGFGLALVRRRVAAAIGQLGAGDSEARA
jgi:PST family polysaccharide transporter